MLGEKGVAVAQCRKNKKYSHKIVESSDSVIKKTMLWHEFFDDKF